MAPQQRRPGKLLADYIPADSSSGLRSGPSPAPSVDPLRRYALLARTLDVVVILLAGIAGCVARVLIRESAPITDVGLALTTLVVASVWVLLLNARGAYDTRILGLGQEEFKRVLLSAVWLFFFVASASYLLNASLSRSYALAFLITGTILLAVNRFFLRRWLYVRRQRGLDLSRMLILGSAISADRLKRVLDAHPVTGFRVVQIMLPPSAAQGELDVWLDKVIDTIETERIQAVAVAHSAVLDPEVVRRLGWRLEGPRVDLLVEPAFGDLTGPRVTVRPAPGLPLLHLDEPHLTGPKRFLKRVMDLALASLALIVLSPLLLCIAFAIRVTGSGRVFFVQERVGKEGRLFHFVKFRTMVEGAHGMRPDVLGDPDHQMPDRYRTDPRVTRVGRFLRRWSLDELPQLLNVLTGSMSLVGPRPMLIEELPLLADADHRRHLTKPGLTGLWQVSGRKEVDWDERMRLDLYYVENWSPIVDVVILFRTIKAVFVGDGAY